MSTTYERYVNIFPLNCISLINKKDIILNSGKHCRKIYNKNTPNTGCIKLSTPKDKKIEINYYFQSDLRKLWALIILKFKIQCEEVSLSRLEQIQRHKPGTPAVGKVPL
jgi:hypothetical protein